MSKVKCFCPFCKETLILNNDDNGILHKCKLMEHAMFFQSSEDGTHAQFIGEIHTEAT
jgi:hypothetical protein